MSHALKNLQERDDKIRQERLMGETIRLGNEAYHAAKRKGELWWTQKNVWINHKAIQKQAN